MAAQYELRGPTLSYKVKGRSLYVGKPIVELLPADIAKSITVDNSCDRELMATLSLVDSVVFADGTVTSVEEFALLMGFETES